MEQATLRPVPLRPVGPVNPAEALAHVLSALPELADDAAQALALVEIAGRTRDGAGEEMQVAADALAELLYTGRKALRRAIFPLSASGWCERAERLLSDRIDGALVPPGPARLDVHLRNCERCVEHERRLSQARERLVRDFIDAHPHIEGAGPAERPVATLRVVEPVAVERRYDGPTRVVAGFGGAETQADDGPGHPHLSFAGPGGQAAIRVEVRRSLVPSEPARNATEPALERDDLPPDPPLDDDIPPSEPADTTPSEHDAEDPDPPVEETQGAADAVPLAWGGLTVIPVTVAIILLAAAVLVVSSLL